MRSSNGKKQLQKVLAFSFYFIHLLLLLIFSSMMLLFDPYLSLETLIIVGAFFSVSRRFSGGIVVAEKASLRFTLPAWLKPLVIVACQTGLRRSNLTGLTVSHLDFTADRIIIGRTKNGDPIGIAMTSIVKKTLLDVLGLRKVVSPYVFSDAHGKPLSPYKVSVAFKRACKRAKVDNLRLHDLRHDFATLMLRRTKNLVDVQHAMGHKDSRMTMRYAHLLPDDLKEAFNAIDNEGTASIFSRFLHVEEKIKGVASATP